MAKHHARLQALWKQVVHQLIEVPLSLGFMLSSLILLFWRFKRSHWVHERRLPSQIETLARHPLLTQIALLLL